MATAAMDPVVEARVVAMDREVEGQVMEGMVQVAEGRAVGMERAVEETAAVVGEVTGRPASGTTIKSSPNLPTQRRTRGRDISRSTRREKR